MKLEKKKLIVKREYKEVYKCEDGIVKIFEKDHPKADVFNEALNTARVEATGLDIPCVKEVSQGFFHLLPFLFRHCGLPPIQLCVASKFSMAHLFPVA